MIENKQILEIEDYLRINPSYSIDIRDRETNDLLYRKLTLAKLKEKAESLYVLLVASYQKGVSSFMIQKFKPNGTSNTKFELPYIIRTENKDSRSSVTETVQSATAIQPAVAPAVSHTATMYPQQNGFGLNGVLGMNAVETVNLFAKSQRFEEIKTQNDELKEENRLLKREIEKLVNEKRELETDLKFAERDKSLELKQRDLAEKPAFSPEMLSLLKEIAPVFLSKVSGANATGMNAAQPTQQLSESKEGLISIVKAKEFTDAMAMNLIYIAIGMQNLKEFSEDLKEIIDKHNVKEFVK